MRASARSVWFLLPRFLASSDDGCGKFLTDNNFAAWNTCRVRGGKQAYPAPIANTCAPGHVILVKVLAAGYFQLGTKLNRD